jgi:hypothetical protein
MYELLWQLHYCMLTLLLHCTTAAAMRTHLDTTTLNSGLADGLSGDQHGAAAGAAGGGL